MKRSLIILAASATIGTAASQAALVANYTFEGNNNSALGSFTGTNVNATTTYVAGKFGQAVSLTAGTDAINLGSTTFGAIGAGDFSISMWINWSGSITSDPAYFSNKNWNSGTNQGLNFAFNSATTTGSQNINTYGGGSRKDVTSGVLIASGAWHNLIFVRSGTTFTLYVDGTQAGQNTTLVAGADFSSANNFFLGDDGATGFYNTTPKWSNPLLIDDLAVYSNAIGAGTIASLQTTAAASAVPEPSTYGLMGAGALAAASLVRRRRKVA